MVMMTREQMIDKVIRTNGFENKWTIWFCRLAEDESLTDEQLENAMVCAITLKCQDQKQKRRRCTIHLLFLCGAPMVMALRIYDYTIPAQKSQGKSAKKLHKNKSRNLCILSIVILMKHGIIILKIRKGSKQKK